MFRRRTHRVNCFYCNSNLDLVQPLGKGKQKAELVALGSSDNFWCSCCSQWNRRAENGDIISDEAAHHLPELNEESFSKRATPNRSRLPPSYSTSPFCRTCLSNQSLQLHLLASYPASSDSDSDTEAPPHLLPEYKASLDARYPLVCSACAPAVEEAIAEKDAKAKSAALGWRLRESRKGRLKEAVRERERWSSWRWWALGVAWGARGAAFWATHLAGLLGCAAATARPHLFVPSNDGASISNGWMPIVAFVSFLWAFWDPTWARARNEKSLGRPPEVVGRSAFIAIQAALYLLRLSLALLYYFQTLSNPLTLRRIAASSLLIFASALLASLHTIHLKHPTSIRLSTTSRPRLAPSSPPQDPADPLAALSLSPLPLTGASTLRQRQGRVEMFGSRLDEDGSTQALARNTFPAPPPHPAVRMDLDADPSVDGENSMDWTPLPPTPTSSSSRPKPHGARDTEREREGWVQLAPPRFFAPDKQEPTGLEGLFEKSLRVSGEVQGVGGGGKVRARARERWWKVW